MPSEPVKHVFSELLRLNADCAAVVGVGHLPKDHITWVAGSDLFGLIPRDIPVGRAVDKKNGYVSSSNRLLG